MVILGLDIYTGVRYIQPRDGAFRASFREHSGAFARIREISGAGQDRELLPVYGRHNPRSVFNNYYANHILDILSGVYRTVGGVVYDYGVLSVVRGRRGARGVAWPGPRGRGVGPPGRGAGGTREGDLLL